MTQSRKNRKTVATDTLALIEQGYYEHPSSHRQVDLHKSVQYAIDHSMLYGPETSFTPIEGPSFNTRIEVHNSTSLEACTLLKNKHPLCLNFASAKNPGGGFLGGSSAQEESLARSSALYPTLLQHPTYYEMNRANRSCFYLEYMIYSPQVPVFKNDDASLRHSPELVSFITAPAVNAGVVREKEPERIEEIPVVMAQRIDKVLSIALEHGHHHLVLGAWGCGVFKNDPVVIAGLFAQALASQKFANRFEHIIFAVLDRKESAYRFNAFCKAFKHLT